MRLTQVIADKQSSLRAGQRIIAVEFFYEQEHEKTILFWSGTHSMGLARYYALVTVGHVKLWQVVREGIAAHEHLGQPCLR
jgi:hypothetical protein